MYNMQVDKSFRMGMMWFIFSEVMFFAAFFGALFYARSSRCRGSAARASRSSTSCCCGRTTRTAWPTNGPAAHRRGRHVRDHPGLRPAGCINTAILLTSGVTITIAHHALRAGNRGHPEHLPGATFLLGFLFVGLQADGIPPRLHRARPDSCPPASTARRSSCSPASTACT
jgi:cytochrome c oxidase subunit 3